jgi:hypothetical protein
MLKIKPSSLTNFNLPLVFIFRENSLLTKFIFEHEMSIVTLADPLVNGEGDLNTDQSYLYMVLLQRKSDRGFKEKDILVSP